MDLDSCSYDGGRNNPPSNGGDSGGSGGGGSGYNSINIQIFSPKEALVYSGQSIPVKVLDTNNNAKYWTYDLNGGPEIPFTPNISITSPNEGTNVLKIHARISQSSSYSPYEIVNFMVSNDPGVTCGDGVCGVDEDCDICSSDCGSCSLVSMTPTGEGSTSSGWNLIIWIAIIVIVIGLLVLVYLIYRKSKGKSLSNLPTSKSSNIPPSLPPYQNSSNMFRRRF